MAVIQANAWVSFLFGVSMQPLFDMIYSLQMIALIPYTNVPLPANSMSLFQVLVAAVAFEYFKLYDPGFTDTPPYSEKFDMYGTGSVNFL